MTTLPPNYLRLSSKWLETNPLPEDGLLLEADDTWKPSSQRGRITAIPGFDYATARTDLPREAYAESDPTPDLTQAELPKAGLTQPEVASERAEDRITGWVNCPVCGEPDMRRTEDPEGNPLIFCVNHACRSNGGTNDDAITQDALEAEREKRKETAKDFETAFRLFRQENDTLRAQLEKAQAFKTWVHDWLDKNGVPHDPDPEHTKECGCRINGRMAFLRSRAESAEAERDKLRAEVEELREENAVLKSQVENADINLQQVHLTQKGIWRTKVESAEKEITRLTAELDAVRKDRDAEVHQTEAFIRALGHGWSGTKTIEDRQEFLKAIHQSYFRWIEWKEEAQARCGDLERAVAQARNWEFLDNHKEGCQMFGLHPKPCSCGKEQRIAYLDQFLTPSQQPDNLKGGEPCAQTVSVSAQSTKDSKEHIESQTQTVQSTESASNPQPESPIPSGVGQPDNFDSSSTEGRAERVANRRGVTMPERGSSENQSSPAVNHSHPEPVKAGEWLPIESAPKDGTRIRVRHEDGSIEDGVYWQKEGRCCILGGRAGAYPPGWTSTVSGNLPIDPPTHWQPIAPEWKATEGEG